MRTHGVKITIDQLVSQAPLPCILYWEQKHFVVCYKIKKTSFYGLKNRTAQFYIADPALGKRIVSTSDLDGSWVFFDDGISRKGAALLLEPSPLFYEEEDRSANALNLSYFIKYLKPFKSQILQVITATGLISIIQLIIPFLSQAMVDNGINNLNINLITLLVIAQFVFYFSELTANFLRSWLVLFTTRRINIALISDFLFKLMRLPMKYFDTRFIGDLMQRINDNDRIQNFLTSQSISVVFSFINFITFSIILGYYKLSILLIFLIGHVLYVVWITSFLKRRRELDYKRFSVASSEQSCIVEIVTGMQDIKLSNSERQKLWTWQGLQAKLLKISMSGLALNQYQEIGASFFSEAAILLINYVAACSVVNGSMTLGMMLSISYIIAQLTTPLANLVGFIQSYQDAKISVERLSEIHQREDEFSNTNQDLLPPRRSAIKIQDVSFSYDGNKENVVLEHINLLIPQNQTTAIVGASGSGKSTLVKLLLGFYFPTYGDIRIGEVSLKKINPYIWRDNVGVVLQDSYIFSDSIAANIAEGCHDLDEQKVEDAAQTANISDFIESLPMGYKTKIGQQGRTLSQGQKQRMIIARALYKNPNYLFFDEATNSLDTTNERRIMENLQTYYHKKTIIIVAHRLSTVRTADNIVVLDKGRIVEQGSHDNLVARKGYYYKLIKNQLELGV